MGFLNLTQYIEMKRAPVSRLDINHKLDSLHVFLLLPLCVQQSLNAIFICLGFPRIAVFWSKSCF